MNEKNCKKIISFYEGVNTRWDKVPFMTLFIVGINALIMWMTYGIAMDGEDWMAYGAYFLLGMVGLSWVFSVGYLIFRILKKTKVMFSLSLCFSFVCFCLMFLYAAMCNLINNYEWLGSLVLAIVFLIAFVVWNVWIIRCIWKDIKDGCYSDSEKISPQRIDNIIICIALIPLLPALGSMFFRKHMGDILGSEIAGIFMVYAVVVVNMLLSKFIIKFIMYTILCFRRKN